MHSLWEREGFAKKEASVIAWKRPLKVDPFELFRSFIQREDKAQNWAGI